VLAGIAVALFGLVPRWSAAAWGALVAFLVLTELGSTLNLSHWVTDISPFSHVPKLPGGTFTAVPLLWLAFAAAVLTAVGLAGLRRRDIT
jgi:ABC-2 type transport system permease protein